MTPKQIQAIGNLLAFYRTDLNYIRQFQNFKNGLISKEKYVQKDLGSFYSFLVEFRVARNFRSGKVDKLLSETYEWINSTNSNNVDLFAAKLKSDLTRNKIMSSMASKILFLNNPWEIIPMDSLARKTLKQNPNNYTIYQTNLEEFKNINKEIIKKSIEYTKPLANIIHTEFTELDNLDKIFENRIIDKLLWTRGK